ncbi:MAG TPA: EamA family transporter [Nitrospiria bacterium]|nr:EamA family transporter [Nitrospiria bacterium]
MTPTATLIWLGNILFDTAGHLSFKAAATGGEERNGFRRWAVLLSDRWIWMGLAAFVAEFMLWLAFLSLVPLSQAVLVGSVNILAILLGGRLLFGERLTGRRIAGSLLIAAGVVWVGWG